MMNVESPTRNIPFICASHLIYHDVVDVSIHVVWQPWQAPPGSEQRYYYWNQVARINLQWLRERFQVNH